LTASFYLRFIVDLSCYLLHYYNKEGEINMKVYRYFILVIFLIILLSLFGGFSLAFAQMTTVNTKGSLSSNLASYGSEDFDRQIAAAFAPTFYQSLGSQSRFDFITNFDFDGDWRGDNNWTNAANPRFPLPAYIYYSVAETETHYFVTYAVFHPRDYKGGDQNGIALSEAIEKGIELLGGKDPTGLSNQVTLAHENDLEGVLVVAEKRGKSLHDAQVQYVETTAHNRFLKYVSDKLTMQGFEPIRLNGQHPELYIEPRGHGILSNLSDRGRNQDGRFLIYSYTGKPSDPVKESNNEKIGYTLIPIYSTLWSQALLGESQTYALTNDYTKLLTAVRINYSKGANLKSLAGNTTVKLGSAFRGSIGGKNRALAPWGWFDLTERDRPIGEWFFDPAGTVKRHFRLEESFSIKYTHAPTVGITRKKV
jgi:hypothetical protein